jgi:hypothetical protein
MLIQLTSCSLIALVLGAALTASCGDPRVPGIQVTTRDSAGVVIIGSNGDPWTTEPRWRLSAAPVLRIGSVAGEAPYQFDGIIGVAILGDGRLVIANRGSSTIRWFNSQGEFLFERGRAGDGPGEFQRLGSILRVDSDSIAVVDPSQRRVQMFASDGSLGPVIAVGGLPTSLGRVYRLQSGDWVTSSSGVSSDQFGPEQKSGVFRTRVPVIRIAADGSRTDTVGVFPAVDVQVAVRGPRSYSFGPAQFGRNLHYAAVGGYIYIGTADLMEIDVYAPDGRHLRSIRAPDVSVVLSEQINTEYRTLLRRRIAELAPEDRPDAEREIAAIVLPSTVPAYSSLRIDDAGNIWVGEYRFDFAPPRRYLVFNPEGEFVTVVVVPERFTPMAITRDRIWGLATDSLDVQYVAAHAIER